MPKIAAYRACKCKSEATENSNVFSYSDAEMREIDSRRGRRRRRSNDTA